MNIIHDWIRLHSTGSQIGSSSVKQASIKQIINNPLKYKKPSPIVRLKIFRRFMRVTFNDFINE
jgi:hypothetical protein